MPWKGATPQRRAPARGKNVGAAKSSPNSQKERKRTKYGLKVTVQGFLVRDPELRYLGKGDPVCNLLIAVPPEYADEKPLWMKATVWEDAETVADALQKGAGVEVIGSLKVHYYQGKPSLVMRVFEVGPWEPAGKNGGRAGDEEEEGDLPF